MMKTDLVVAGYIYHNDKVLLVHHKKLDLWLPVGGHIDANETPDDALHREVKEETGMDIEILNQNSIPVDSPVKKNLAIPFNVNVHSAGDHDHCCFFYVCRALNPEKMQINHELNSFQWLSKEELGKSYIPQDVRAMALKGFEIIEGF
ncbi:MAG TPA: NUDIX domain-containing protein [Candidatus Nanoarchaeia archaeon]|nr:NUDIX domain-containing protein [Candidatus Nanoarchaeia archaeon]